jgi:hypothetical protein
MENRVLDLMLMALPLLVNQVVVVLLLTVIRVIFAQPIGFII